MRQRIGSYCAFAQSSSFLCAARRCIAGIVFLAAAHFSTSLQASSISFAQFTEASPGGNLFAYFDNGAASNSQFGTLNGTFGAAIPVNFTYLTVGGSLPADLTGNQAAMLSMTTSTTSAVTPVAIPSLGVTIGAQQFPQVVSDTISIIRNTPAAEGNNPRTNLLTVTFTGQLLGTLTGRTPQFSSDTGLNYTVTYTSDFLTFDDDAEKDFSLTFSSWTSGDGGGLELSSLSLDQFFASALASGAGTFDGTATVPEPAGWLLGTIGMLLLVVAKDWLRPKEMAKIPVRR